MPTFYVMDRETKYVHFAVNGKTCPLEELSTLLAMHCFTRRVPPGAFCILTDETAASQKALGTRTAAILERVQFNPPFVMTRRERQVLSGITAGLVNKEIGRELNISERTVKFHVSSLLAKFNVRGRVELAAIAGSHGLANKEKACLENPKES